MSKYLVQRAGVRFDDLDALCEALKQLGIPHERAAKGQTLPLFGYTGDQRKEHAAVVVRRAHIGSSANDLGFAADGTVIISEWDNEAVTPGRGKHVLQKVTPAYSAARVVRRVRAQGAKARVQATPDGGYKIVIVGR